MIEWKQDSSRRDKLSIIAEILDIAKDGTLKTQLMYKANLSFVQLNDYLKFMLKTSLLSKCLANGKDVYVTTEKGIDFLQRHMELTELIRLSKEERETEKVILITRKKQQ